MKRYAILFCLVAHLAAVDVTKAQCPWHQLVPELQSSCLCAYNLRQELSVQCDTVDFSRLIFVLDSYATSIPLDLLYVNNSTVGILKNGLFQNLRIHSIQISGCKIKTIQNEAFRGQEEYLKNLNLQENLLTVIPNVKSLKRLSLLDLSHNRIEEVLDGVFESTNLTTLKLSDNNITLSPGAFRGIEKTLKNLNLKNTHQKNVPQAIRHLRNLAFLDLSQNSLRKLPETENDFQGLNSLTALNLERNLLQVLDNNTFKGISRTLSSLSLLNNLLPTFPSEAMKPLVELRVLDIGFNLLTEIPNDAFKGNPSLTLLAVDGNPLVTVPFNAISHLNSSLRGLSLGGRFLECDCRLKWIIEWIQKYDLQVTSRERNPQFCGSPAQLRDRGFYSIQPEEFVCADGVGVATVFNPDNEEIILDENLYAPVSSTRPTTTSDIPITTSRPSTTTSHATTTNSNAKRTTEPGFNISKASVPPWRSHQSRPPILGFPSPKTENVEVAVKNAYRQDNSVIIQWRSSTANILGFRVVYRLFGDKTFKQGPPLEASEREFKIKNVPSQECIVVCVISLEETNVTPETVPHSQCREVRTVTPTTSNMDKITIAASAAICGTIIIAVIVFVITSKRRSNKMMSLQGQKLGVTNPITGMPVNCCTGPTHNTSLGGPLSSLTALNVYNTHKEWDQVSTYSAQSMQRPQIYSMEQPASLTEFQSGMRMNFGTKGRMARSIADGQSQHSFSNNSGRYLSGFSTNLIASQDLRQSRQSLAMQSDRLSRKSHGMSQHASNHSQTSSTRRARSRSHSHDHRSHYNSFNYCENSDNNWTDHDMDIYMARNPTAHGGLVPL